MADGYEEKRVAWEENRKREKKKGKKNRDDLVPYKRGESH